MAVEQNASAATTPPRLTALQKSRTESRRTIWRWMLLAGLVITAAMIVVMLLREAEQVSLIADFMLIVMVLCPMLLCLGPLAVGLWVAVFAMSRVDNLLGGQIDRLEGITQSLSERTAKASEALSKRSISFSAQFAILDRLFNPVDKSDNAKSDRDSITPE